MPTQVTRNSDRKCLDCKPELSREELAPDTKLECHIISEWFSVKNANPLLHLE